MLQSPHGRRELRIWFIVSLAAFAALTLYGLATGQLALP